VGRYAARRNRHAGVDRLEVTSRAPAAWGAVPGHDLPSDLVDRPDARWGAGWTGVLVRGEPIVVIRSKP